MSTRLDSSNHLRSTLWWRNLNLQWPIGLAIAVLAPLSLPVATSPVTLAAFAVAMISLIVLARSTTSLLQVGQIYCCLSLPLHFACSMLKDTLRADAAV